MTTPNPAINESDIKGPRNEYLFPLPKPIRSWITELLINKSDIIMIYLLYNISITVFPYAILLYYLQNPPILLGVGYILMLFVLYYQRFILTLHFASHKPLFKSRWFDLYLQYLVCPFFGLPSGAYRNHHVVMHHVENNVFPYDVSATMNYRRDSFYNFLCYWLRYVLAIWVQLPYYLYFRARYNLLIHTLTSIISYLALTAYLLIHYPLPTLYVVVIPFVLSSFLLMLGNWSQHIFVDPTRPTSSYALTYNIINSPMNSLTYNDGYHIVHHLYSQLHWSELPKYFSEHTDKFVKERSLTFEGVDFVEVGLSVMFGRWEYLAKKFVHIGEKKSDEEVIKMLKEWCSPIVLKEEEKKE